MATEILVEVTDRGLEFRTQMGFLAGSQMQGNSKEFQLFRATFAAALILPLLLGGRVVGGSIESDCFEPLEEQLLRTLYQDDLEEAASLIDQGADPNAQGCNGTTISQRYMTRWMEDWDETGDFDAEPEVVEFLLINGADPNLQDEFGLSMMAAAVSEASPEVLERVLNYGGDPNQHSLEGVPSYPIFRLGIHNRPRRIDALRVLFGAGADLTVRSRQGTTVLYEAIAVNDFELAAALLELAPQLRCAVVERHGRTITFENRVERTVGNYGPDANPFRARVMQLAEAIECAN